MGKFGCRCGFVWTLQAETAYGGHLIPNAVIFDAPEPPARLLEFAAGQPQVLRCPNCRAVVVEDAEGIHPQRLVARAIAQ